MKHSSPESPQEKDVEWKEFSKEVIIDTVIGILIFIVCILLMLSLSSCSITFNVAADGQPNTIIYTDDTVGKCE